MVWSEWFWLALLLYIAGGFVWYRERHWLLFYLWGSAGITIMLIYLSITLGWETALEQLEIVHTSWLISPWIETAGSEGSNLMVTTPTGWTLLRIGIECSAVIEISALLGLMLFYPRFEPSRKLATILIGSAATYALNIFRLMVIAAMTFYIGNQAVIVAHTVVGRMIFFVGVVALYWYLITRPTLNTISVDISMREHA